MHVQKQVNFQRNSNERLKSSPKLVDKTNCVKPSVDIYRTMHLIAPIKQIILSHFQFFFFVQFLCKFFSRTDWNMMHSLKQYKSLSKKQKSCISDWWNASRILFDLNMNDKKYKLHLYAKAQTSKREKMFRRSLYLGYEMLDGIGEALWWMFVWKKCVAFVASGVIVMSDYVSLRFNICPLRD